MNEGVEKVARNVKLTEAADRMKSLEINEDAILGLVQSDVKPVSFDGIDGLYGFKAGAVKDMEDFEEKYNALIYFVIYTPSDFGDMVSYLYVCDDEDEWEMDRNDLHEGYAMTWTENLDHPECSEFGSIAFSKTSSGGLKRVA